MTKEDKIAFREIFDEIMGHQLKEQEERLMSYIDLKFAQGLSKKDIEELAVRFQSDPKAMATIKEISDVFGISERQVRNIVNKHNVESVMNTKKRRREINIKQFREAREEKYK